MCSKSVQMSKYERIFHFKPWVYLAYVRSYCHFKIVKCIGMCTENSILKCQELPGNVKMTDSSLNSVKWSKGDGVGGGVGDQLPTFDAESKSAKIPKSNYGGGGGVWNHNQFILILVKLSDCDKICSAIFFHFLADLSP